MASNRPRTPGTTLPLTGLALLALIVALLGQSGARADEPMGAEGCATCHDTAFSTWKKGPHARAADRLTLAQKADPRCQTCHTPHDVEGLTGVQCESCHGEGTYYARSYVMRDPELARLTGLRQPKAEDCQRCHVDGPSLRAFDFEEARQRIRHWPEEQ
ncbi:MAG: multiheme c-type cytochrome [Deltaproteobacteria bacterium]|nr:multiheme c-type cytochrome [Deltaproteobacteria bacterium]